MPEPNYACAENKEMWLKCSVGMIVGLVIPYTVFTFYKEFTHEHHEHVGEFMCGANSIQRSTGAESATLHDLLQYTLT
jgi:hypothetical protein